MHLSIALSYAFYGLVIGLFNSDQQMRYRSSIRDNCNVRLPNLQYAVRTLYWIFDLPIKNYVNLFTAAKFAASWFFAYQKVNIALISNPIVRGFFSTLEIDRFSVI